MLIHQVDRVKRSKLIEKIVVATSENEDDIKVGDACSSNEVDCYRGSLDNVLERVYKAAKKFKPKHVVRLTADCPLTDWTIIDKVIEIHLESDADYTSNCLTPTYPDGLDVEVMKFSCLEEAAKKAQTKHQLEHVTPYIKNHPDCFKLVNVTNEINLSELRWTVDEPEDMAFVKIIYDKFYNLKCDFKTDDILKLLEEQPNLSKMNKKFERNEGSKYFK